MQYISPVVYNNTCLSSVTLQSLSGTHHTASAQGNNTLLRYTYGGQGRQFWEVYMILITPRNKI